MKPKIYYLYVFTITLKSSYSPKNFFTYCRKKIQGKYQKENMIEEPCEIEERGEEKINHGEFIAVNHSASMVEKDNNFKYYDRSSKSKERVLKKKWAEYKNRISRVKNLYKKEQIELRKFIGDSIFYHKFQEFMKFNPEVYEFEDEIKLGFMCFEKCIEIIYTKTDKCALITFLKMFFEGNLKFLMNRKGNYMLKTFTLFLYGLYDPYSVKIDDFPDIITKITNIRYINLDQEEIYKKFCDSFCDLFYIELLEFSKEFLLDQMVCK